MDERLSKTLERLITALGDILPPHVVQQCRHRTGTSFGQEFRYAHRKSGEHPPPFSRAEYLQCLTSLASKGLWEYVLIEDTEDRLRLNVPTCPFGKAAARTSGFCIAECGIVGSMAAEMLNASTVVVAPGKGSPPKHCRITVYAKHSDKSLSPAGIAGAAGRAAKGRAATDAPNEPMLSTISRREGQVLRLIGEGLSDKEIAAKLNLSVRTVEKHGASIRAKLHVRSRSHLIRFALRHHLARA